MAICSRRFLLALTAGVMGLGLASCGDFGSLAYFLSPEQRIEPRMRHLAASKKDKKEPLVLILTWAGLEMRSEFIHADRQLAELLGQQLKVLAEQSDEKIAIVPPRKVEEFKNQNPTWRAMQLTDIGR